MSTRIQPIRRSSEAYGVEPGDPGRPATLAGAVPNGIPTPACSSSLAYYDGIPAERLPAALIEGGQQLATIRRPGLAHRRFPIINDEHAVAKE